MNIHDRISKLRAEIESHRYAYYVLDKPKISDEAYDSLMQELEILEAKYPDFEDINSPTKRVGAEPLKAFTAVAHQTPMLSLNDVFSREELEAWLTRITKLLPADYDQGFHIDIKMDGLAAALIYENGILVRGLTRGDGYVGEEVTLNLRTIGAVPLQLRRDSTVPIELYRGRLEVRGEVLIYMADFEKLNQSRAQKNEKLYANPRNLAAGSIRQLNPKLTAARPLRFHAYSVISESPLPSHYEEYKIAQKLGFIVNKGHRVVKDVEGIMQAVLEWEEKRLQQPFNTDGLVITVNGRKVFSNLGVVGKAPRGAVAYKYPAEQATTKLVDIQISIGRTGAATPFAVLEPVRIAGTTVQMATLHNEGEVARKDVRIGDTVIVHKAGDIIPEVIQSLPKLRDGSEKVFKMPQNCPVSGDKLVKVKANEAVWRCPNKSCPARQRGQIVHFASKGALDIEGLGEKVVGALLKADLVENPADIFRLKADQLEKLERFGKKSAANLVTAIQNCNHVSLDRLLFGLGIRHIGKQTAIDLAQWFGSLEALQAATLEELEAVPGIGMVVAENLFIWLHEPINQTLLLKFREVGLEIEKLKTGSKLAGKAFVITGTLTSMSREEAAEKIRSLGGKFQSSVGKDTNYLVLGNNPGASKVKQAKEYGTKQINEQELAGLLQ